ncbi:sigma-70 family RNA polymerase sigma factor [Desulfofalx alkaliphila]|uniref:sigma-70 family RNA polymerase sigma factor n=1 Tax=Desulfofalx alkaliphila TaxID=105483 RepID=UPI0004E15333|nr:FliA/WhiG family RNA polymerase sigma factor [Desulfofalx alkaliphila]
MEPEKLWKEYTKLRRVGGNETALNSIRDKLITAYLPLVKNIAGRLAIKIPFFMQQEDLESCGVIGLMEAVDKYDMSLGVGFETFAYHRIRGAMLDELRRQNWVPRTVWQRQQAIKRAREKLEQEGQPVTERALAELTGLSAAEVRRLLSETNIGQLYSLDDEISNGEGSVVRRGDMIEDTDSPDPLIIIDELEDKRLLVESIEELNKREKLLLALYYQEKLTLKEIGVVLEVSESRVCQLHSKAIKSLRQKLRDKLSLGR